MARPPVVSTEKKTLIVVSILRGEVTMAEAAIGFYCSVVGNLQQQTPE